MRRFRIVAIPFILATQGVALASAANLLVNPRFHTNIAGWNLRDAPDDSAKVWSSLDADDDIYSGSGRVTNSSDLPGSGLAPLSQCVPVTPGVTYRFGGEVLIPEGQEPDGFAKLYTIWHEQSGCADNGLSPGGPFFQVTARGVWGSGSSTGVAPPGAVSASVYLGVQKDDGDGVLRTHFDNVEFCRPDSCAEDTGEGWVESGEFPGFRFRVTITPGADVPFFAAKVDDDDCLNGTLCVAGAVANRAEVLLRLIGPRPNGYLWLQVNRFTPNQIDIEVERPSRGERNTYHLDAIPPSDDTLNGFFDRTAFLP